MRRLKVALDCDISHRMVGVLDRLYGQRGFEFVFVTEFAQGSSPDEYWAEAFKKFGGSITISGDSRIAFKPHKALSFIDNGFMSFFLSAPWSAAPGHAKAAHLSYWWPAVERKIAEKQLGRCWRIPCNMKGGELRLAHTELEELRIPDHVLEETRRQQKAKR